MLESSRILDIVGKVVRTRVPGDGLERVLSELTADSRGNDALRITLVLKPEAAERLTGDEALDVLVGIQQNLEAEGEERLPIVGYATEQELADEAAGLNEDD